MKATGGGKDDAGQAAPEVYRERMQQDMRATAGSAVDPIRCSPPRGGSPNPMTKPRRLPRRKGLTRGAIIFLSRTERLNCRPGACAVGWLDTIPGPGRERQWCSKNDAKLGGGTDRKRAIDRRPAPAALVDPWVVSTAPSAVIVVVAFGPSGSGHRLRARVARRRRRRHRAVVFPGLRCSGGGLYPGTVQQLHDAT